MTVALIFSNFTACLRVSIFFSDENITFGVIVFSSSRVSSVKFQIKWYIFDLKYVWTWTWGLLCTHEIRILHEVFKIYFFIKFVKNEKNKDKVKKLYRYSL